MERRVEQSHGYSFKKRKILRRLWRHALSNQPVQKYPSAQKQQGTPYKGRKGD